MLATSEISVYIDMSDFESSTLFKDRCMSTFSTPEPMSLPHVVHVCLCISTLVLETNMHCILSVVSVRLDPLQVRLQQLKH